MSLAFRLAVVFVFITALGGVLLLGRSANLHYDQLRQTVVTEIRAAVAADPLLQVRIYEESNDALADFLDALMALPAASVNWVYDSGGEALAARGVGSAAGPALQRVRGSASAADTVLATSSGVAPGNFWSSLAGGESMLYLSLPVYASVDPTRPNLTAGDFIAALSGPDRNRSRMVIGYVVSGLDNSALVSAAMSRVTGLALLWLMLAMLGGVAVYYLARRMMKPLAGIRQLAQQIRGGEFGADMRLGRGGEFAELASAINEVVSGASRQNKVIEADRRLLSMKAEDRASRLSERERELERAEQEIHEARDRVHRLSNYDSLTSLPNRAMFEEQFRQLLRLRERDERPLALLLVSLLNFKRINDSLGHQAGDQLLAHVGERLTGCVRGSDVLAYTANTADGIPVARLGGDEFAVVLNQLDNADSAGLVAARLVEALSAPVDIEGREVGVTVTVGIAVAPRDGEDTEGLLRAAATAVHHGGAKGGGHFFFKTEMESLGADQFRLEAELRRALERDQLQLHYQPQVDVYDGSIMGAEALLRWEHPEFGQVPPYRFIPLAEQMGMMSELGEWVLSEACRQLQAFRELQLNLPRVAANVSAMEFGEEFAARVRSNLETTGLSPTDLELGLSESILVDNNPDNGRCLRELSGMGVYLSVDDFGAGHAPLSYLGRYAIDEIKLDRGFVVDCDSHEGNARLVTAIAAMADSLQLRLLAEGVETPQEYQFLSARGVRAMQGYLFSKPVPADELKAMLEVPWYFMTQIQRLALTA